MKLASDPDAFIRESTERRQRGIDALRRLAERVGEPERASTNRRARVFELISNHEAFAVSLEMLEAIAEKLDQGVVRCEGCGLSYGSFPLDVIVPDDQWEAITGHSDGGGILCAACIVNRGAKLPGVTVAKMVFE